MTLRGAVDVLTAEQRATHPGNQASGGPARWYPRPLTRGEEESWRDGWLEAKAEGAVYGDSLTVAARPAPVTMLDLARREACRKCPVLTPAAAA